MPSCFCACYIAYLLGYLHAILCFYLLPAACIYACPASVPAVLLTCMPVRLPACHPVFYLLTARTNFLPLSASCLKCLLECRFACCPVFLPPYLFLCYLQSCLSLGPTCLSPYLSFVFCPVACLSPPSTSLRPLLPVCFSSCRLSCLIACVAACMPFCLPTCLSSCLHYP